MSTFLKNVKVKDGLLVSDGGIIRGERGSVPASIPSVFGALRGARIVMSLITTLLKRTQFIYFT